MCLFLLFTNIVIPHNSGAVPPVRGAHFSFLPWQNSIEVWNDLITFSLKSSQAAPPGCSSDSSKAGQGKEKPHHLEVCLKKTLPIKPLPFSFRKHIRYFWSNNFGLLWHPQFLLDIATIGKGGTDRKGRKEQDQWVSYSPGLHPGKILNAKYWKEYGSM